MADEPKMCPLLAMGRLAHGNMAEVEPEFVGGFYQTHCRREKCAWWIGEQQHLDQTGQIGHHVVNQCAVVMLARRAK